MDINTFLNIPNIKNESDYKSVDYIDLINCIDYSHESACYLLNAYSIAISMFFFESSYYDVLRQESILPTNSDISCLIDYILSESSEFESYKLPYMHFLSLKNRNISYVIGDKSIVVGYFAFVSALILYVIHNLILATSSKSCEKDIVMIYACLTNLLNRLYSEIDIFSNIPAVYLRNLIQLLVNLNDDSIFNKIAKESKRKLAGSGGAKKAQNIREKRKAVYDFIDITKDSIDGSVAYKANVLAKRIRKNTDLFNLVQDIKILDNWVFDYLKKNSSKKCAK